MSDLRKKVGVMVAVLVLVALSAATVFAADQCVVRQRMDCSGMDLSNYNFDGAGLRNSTLDGANLSGSSMNGTNWGGSSMRNTDFTGADTAGADFSRVDLTGSNITQAQLDAALKYSRAILPDGTRAGR